MKKAQNKLGLFKKLTKMSSFKIDEKSTSSEEYDKSDDEPVEK
jgi:hypothetical protein